MCLWSVDITIMQINHEKQHKKKKSLLRKYQKKLFAFLNASLLFSLSRVTFEVEFAVVLEARELECQAL